MLRINHNDHTFTRLELKSLTEQGITERSGLQQMIRNSPEPFFEEMGEKLLILGEEIRPAEFVDDRIDLLAIDPQGSAVVIELKRDSNKLQLLQALSYAAMVSKWEGQRFIEERSRFVNHELEEAEEDIESFMTETLESLNSMQRVVLVAEGYDYEVLVTAEWLNENYNVDIRCYRLELSADGSIDFLKCTCVYPPPEITQHVIRRSRRGVAGAGGVTAAVGYADWEEALALVENPAIVHFYQDQIRNGWDQNLRILTIHCRIGSERHFHLKINKKKGAVHVRQRGRFDDDLCFWKSRIGDHVQAKVRNHDKSLIFYLSTAQDFERFEEIVTKELTQASFIIDDMDQPMEDDR